MKKPSSRKSTGASSSDDEVRHSLDLLDSVIGEFDDGLTSAAESDSGLIEAEIRKRPPPKRQNVVNPPEMMSSGLSLTDKIDDIFSELTEEIYSADKQQKIIHRAPMRTESTNSSNNARKLSPIRRVNDPLPTPPQLQETSRKTGAKDEVVVYGEKERPKEVIALKKSVKAQVHSLETRGRHHRIITPATTPAQNNEQNKSTFTKNVNNNNRSRSENPPKAGRGGIEAHRTSKTKNGNGLSLPAKDDFASRVNPDRINKKSGQRNQAPPMPEKTKIHLKSSEKSAKKSDKRQRRPDQPLPDLPSSLEPSSLPSSSHPYEVLPQELSKREAEKAAKADAYRRSKSVGPVVEAAQRELLFNAARDRSRSRGPAGQSEKPSELKRSKSKPRLYEEESNSSSGRGGGGDNRRAFRKENTSLESSRGRSRIKNNVERSVSTSKKIDVMDPFLSALPSRAMPARQKSMIDLRDPHLDLNLHHHHHQIPSHHHRHFMQNTPPRQVNHLMNSPQNLQQQPVPPQQQRPRMVRSATEHEIKVRNRRSMAVGPLEDLPPHIRQHMVRQHGLRMPPTGEPVDPAANNFMFSGANRRPLSARDRQMAEEDALLMRQLTLDSQREFLVRRGFSQNHPYISGEVPIHPELQGRLPFHVPSRTIPMRPDDYQRFKPEYWLQNHNGTPNPVAFTDLAVLQNELELKRRRELHRQNSQKHASRQHQQQESPVAASDRHQNQHIENNFNSLPWEEIIPRRIGGVPVLPAAEQAREQELRNRSKSQDPRKPRGNLFSHLSGSGWFNPGHVWREAEPDVRGLGAGNVKQQGHWLLKERDTPMVSMPPNIDTLRDSGIGLASEEQSHQQHHVLQRNEPKRSSFGMALKDKFNKNPNMYFPGPGSNDGSQKSRSKTNSPTKTHTSIEEDISDTDTLIHNMSEGSYEKDGGSSEDHESFGSAKGSRSSGNSSLSPHNSMEGSPRMLQSQSMQFQPASSGPSSGVNLMGPGKKTIRNYTPKESSNMLREFEDRRNTNSVDYRGERKNQSRSKPRLERKSSVERMIDDFHRNLPPPGVENRQQNNQPEARLNTVGSAQTNVTNTTENSASVGGGKKASKNGTMNSQISNWSAASSAASFDYQPAGLGGLKKYKSTDLPSLDEDDDEPDFERVPPEGMAASVKGQSPTNFNHSPTNFVQRIEVKNRSPSPAKQKSRKTREELLPPPPPPPPPMPVEEDEDEFSNLRKLISEGRIAGLNEKPPSFIPPSPPSSPKKEERSASSRRPSSAKPPAPSTPKTPKSSHSVERGPSKKNPAPKPPTNSSNVSTPSSEVKFVSSRAREPSLEDLTQMSNKKRNEVKRSSSNHGTRPSGFDSSHVHGDTTTAQLIADSTEKKFNFNPFKGKKLFKKKQYSFDFN